MGQSYQELLQALKKEHEAEVDHRIAEEQRQEHADLVNQLAGENTGDYREHVLREGQKMDQGYYAPAEHKAEADYAVAHEKRQEIEKSIAAEEKTERSREKDGDLSY